MLIKNKDVHMKERIQLGRKDTKNHITKQDQHGRIQRGGGTEGLDTPPEKSQKYGVS